MNEVAVIAGATESKGLMPRLSRQLEAAGIPFIIDWQKPYTNPLGRTLGNFCDTLERLLKRTENYKKLVWVDAWDMLFYGTKQELIAKIPECTFGAERNCWPDGYLATSYKGETPWRFMNTGTLAGTWADLFDLLVNTRTHDTYHPDYVDQQWFSHRLLEGKVSIDERTNLVYCMMCERGSLELKDGKLHNHALDTNPLFIHFNGNSGQQLWPIVECAAEHGVRAGIIDSYDGKPGPRQLNVATSKEDAPKLEALLEPATATQ